MYLSGCVPKECHYLLDEQVIGFLQTPNIGNHRKANWVWAADSGCFNRKTYKGDQRYVKWLREQHSKDKCLFATAPDVVGNAESTLRLAQDWLPRIRGLGYPVALVTQDGMTERMVPWDEVDWLFIGGTNAHKLGHEALDLIDAAHERGKKIHVGRVNSDRRFNYFADYGCHTADGTSLGFAPSRELRKLKSWIRRADSHITLFSLKEIRETNAAPK